LKAFSAYSYRDAPLDPQLRELALILPVVAVVLALGLKPYRESLKRSEAWADKTEVLP
jgi:hypothetical protein